MKVQVTYEYLHTFIPKRCRKERQEVRKTTFQATIREVDAKDAPVAFIVRQYGSYPSVVRMFNGRLYRNNFDYATRYVYEDENKLYSRETKHDLIPLVKTDWERMLQPYYGFPNKNENEVKAGARKSARNFIIVDGQLYQLTGEPFYKGVTFGLGHNYGGCGFFAEFLPTVRMKYKEMYPVSFPATQRTEAIKEILMVAIRRGDTESYDYLLRGGNGDIEVLMPEACKFNFKPLHKTLYNTKYPPSQKDWDALDALGEPTPYVQKGGDVLNENDLASVEQYISSIR